MAAENLPNPALFALFPLQESILDKITGEPLSAGVVTFYQDINHSNLKPIYQVVEAPNNTYEYALLNNPITLTSIGTFADDNGNDIIPFLYPYLGSPSDAEQGAIDLYYIEVYAAQPPVGTGLLQFTRSAWPPGIENSVNPIENFVSSDNIISNSQFSQVNFQPTPTNTGAPGISFVINASGSNLVTNIAPDWDIITTGTGTVTIEQITINQGNIPSNPPYALNITTAGPGLTSVILRQTITSSPLIFENNFISGYMLASSLDDVSHQLVMNYVPSGSSTAVTSLPIAIGATNNTNSFAPISGTAQITGFYNPNPAPNGAVDIQIVIPVGVAILITSIQVVSVDNINSIPTYIEKSIPRQTDELFHYYANSCIMQPKNSILTGWDFTLNPFQFITTAATTATSACAYAADQTIFIPQNTSSLSTQFATNETGFQVNAIGGQTQGRFAICQYIDASTCLPYWGSSLSVLVKSSLISSNSTALGLKAMLIYRNTPPANSGGTPPALVNPIASWGTNSIALSAGWTGIECENDPTYFSKNGTETIAAYNGFLLPTLPASTAIFGLILYTTNAMSNAGTPDSFIINSATLVPNSFAIDANPLTFDETLRQCQYYYEMSYNMGILPGTITNSGCLVSNQFMQYPAAVTPIILYSSDFGFAFKHIKRSINPSVILYSPYSGTSNYLSFHTKGIRGLIYAFDIVADARISNASSPPPYGFWNASNISQSAITYYGSIGDATNVTPYYSTSGITSYTWDIATVALIYHYTSDARLGLVP